jgi:multidrug efflux pump
MVISDVSIKRPVFAAVVSAILVVFGLFAFDRLTVREFPAADPPIVSISTTYRGASSTVVENKVTTVIEDAVSGIEGVRSIRSTSRDGSSSVSIEFQIDRDFDAAVNDVRDRLSRVLSALPDEADSPRLSKVEADARPILIIALTSDRMNQLELTDYASRFVVDRLSAVEGVANVRVGGERRYSMRIWLDRRELAARMLTVQDVESALRRQNVELPAGRIESREREFTVRTDTTLRTPDQFRNIVLSVRDGYPVRLGEVAQVELAAEDTRGELRNNGRTAVGLLIFRQSTANELTTSDGVKAEIARLSAAFPPGMEADVARDSAVFIARAIYEVEHAILIALFLVIGVIFLFLRSIRATIIPALAIPVSLIGTMIVLTALGYTINVLTLLAFVLAVGLVVDDAIVVLENIHRRIEQGEPPLLASVYGARQIGFAVVATTLVLAAVFVPLSFMPGGIGRLFREFGITVATAVVFSGLVALTLAPMMCSKLLKPVESEGLLVRLTEPVFQGMNAAYRWTLRAALAAPLIVAAGAAAMVGASAFLFRELPREFVPQEDRGGFIVIVNGPEGASFEWTDRYVRQIEGLLQPYVQDGIVRRVTTNVAPSWGRPGDVRQAFIFVTLANWEDRDRRQQDLVRELFPRLQAIPGVVAFASNPSGLPGAGGNQPIQFVIGGSTYEELAEWRDRILPRLNAYPGVQNIRVDYDETNPQLLVDIDRARANDLGLSLDDIGRTLETLLGARNVTTFQDRGTEFNVVLQARPEDRSSPRDLTNIFVRSQTTRELVPLATVVRLVDVAGAAELPRYDRLRSIGFTANLGPDATLGQALEFIEGVIAEELPPEARLSWRGESREYQESGNSLLIIFGLALVVVFLVLAAQFESLIHPLIVMLTVPLAVTGSLLTIWWTGATLNIFSQIGMIMLIGIVAKNGILIVEFANQLRDEEGMSVPDAVLEASVTRLRPILMTSIATAIGAMPLAFASGAGAETRSAIGMVIMGGTLFATLFTLYVVPVFYRMLAGFTKPAGHVERMLRRLEEERVAPGPAAEPAHGHAQAVPARAVAAPPAAE